MSVQPPPIYERIAGEDGKAPMPWVLFMNQIFNGDSGTDWTPTFVNLTEAGGAATITGRFYKISQYITYFRVSVVPVTSTSATAESTYISNFPLTFKNNGICFAVRGGAGSNAGHIVPETNRIYVPTWTTVTSALHIIGIGEAS